MSKVVSKDGKGQLPHLFSKFNILECDSLKS